MNTEDFGQGGAATAPKQPPRALQAVNAFLTSPKLAIALLAVVLVCCVVGVTVFRGARAGALIFGTLWFNGLLVLLAVSSGVTFFSRIWRRKLTVVSVGMILFHLSFVALLGGIVYNRLFYFRGVLRLTEGETLPNGQPESYDLVEKGRFFSFSRLRGETTLVKMHVDYKVGGDNKRAAYEIAVQDGEQKARSIIYVTEYLDFRGVRYFCLKEGYSVLLVLRERDGKETFGIHVPLQSYRQKDGAFTYAAGSPEGPVAFPFPPPPEQPRSDVVLGFRPSTVKQRDGEVTFKVRPLVTGHRTAAGAPLVGKEVDGKVVIGGRFDAGEFLLEPREIRYWVGMDVRSDPGLTVIFSSLVFGLAGMFVTLVGRVRQGARRRPAQT